MPCNNNPRCEYKKPKCKKGRSLYKNLRKACDAFNEGGGTYEAWKQAWSKWEQHYKSKRKLKETGGTMIQDKQKSGQTGLDV